MDLKTVASSKNSDSCLTVSGEIITAQESGADLAFYQADGKIVVISILSGIIIELIHCPAEQWQSVLNLGREYLSPCLSTVLCSTVLYYTVQWTGRQLFTAQVQHSTLLYSTLYWTPLKGRKMVKTAFSPTFGGLGGQGVYSNPINDLPPCCSMYYKATCQTTCCIW